MVENVVNFSGVLVVTAEQAETVRVIRNHCRQYMTRVTDNIGPDQQLSWWLTLNKQANRLFLFKIVAQDVPGVIYEEDIGYGLCRLIGGKWWVSGGLSPEWQGKGFGNKLFSYLVEQTGTPCWLEVLSHNTRAYNVYKNLGFVETSHDGDVATMVKR